MSRLQVTAKLKVGNTVKYKCRDIDNNAEGILEKDELVAKINNGQVINARVQVYKGNSIIRLKDDIDKTQTTVKSSRVSKKKVLMLDIYKKLLAEFNIQHIEDALSTAFDRYDLDTEVDTTNIKEYTKIKYQLASEIKRMADMENNSKLLRYKGEYEDAHK